MDRYLWKVNGFSGEGYCPQVIQEKLVKVFSVEEINRQLWSPYLLPPPHPNPQTDSENKDRSVSSNNWEMQGLRGPGRCCSVARASAQALKGGWFDSQLRACAWVTGSIPSPVGAHAGSSQSLSLSPRFHSL